MCGYCQSNMATLYVVSYELYILCQLATRVQTAVFKKQIDWVLLSTSTAQRKAAHWRFSGQRRLSVLQHGEFTTYSLKDIEPKLYSYGVQGFHGCGRRKRRREQTDARWESGAPCRLHGGVSKVLDREATTLRSILRSVWREDGENGQTGEYGGKAWSESDYIDQLYMHLHYSAFER